MLIASSFSIIIFAYNEGSTLYDLFVETKTVLDQFTSDHEIIIVDDGSTDDTGNAIDLITEKHQVKVINHPHNKGIGAALRSGYMAASKELVCAIPGDAQFNPHELLKIQQFDKDTIYAFTRQNHEYSLYRRALSAFNRILNRLILGVSLQDVNWIKVYRKEHLERITINLESSLIESEICAKLNKCKLNFEEIPSDYLPREAGVSKGGNLKTVTKALVEMFRLIREVLSFNPKLL